MCSRLRCVVAMGMPEHPCECNFVALVRRRRDTRVPPFTLVVLANRSTLSVNGKQINSSFGWEM
ncbi:hypothetical protein GUH57_13410 [Xanthomonas citri pv. citri]|nr:hypothetical protein [Xanthomonas citri pv. citri]MBD4151070.1 hypothetical protein [Xanthomonas citri pv. citri]MBD4158233.1 hypothetical protein [Xanthomonas citri pv. citri]MBD4169748.1 hypothetical protein [Xanthomonas citri pv. citri]MBD4215178.1 hypothetical protein [Xanthomonas citri pv. citri]